MAEIKADVNTPAFRYVEPEVADATIRNRAKYIRETKHTKWPQNELILRNQLILDMISRGVSRRKCVEQMMDRWEVSEDCAYDYYKAALKRLMTENEEFVEYNRDKMVERMEHIIEDCLEHNHPKEAVMACQELNKLLGLTTSTKLTLEADSRVFKFGDE